MNNDIVNMVESIGKVVNEVSNNIRKSFGLLNEVETSRVEYLIIQGYSAKESKAIVKLENGIAITDSEFKIFIELINRIGRVTK